MLTFCRQMIWASWSDRQFIMGFTCILSHIVASTKIGSINVPLLLIILVGKSITCVRLNVFIKVSSFNVSLLGPASNCYNEAVDFRR